MTRVSQTRFESKVALVTGAASGIGRATALALAHEGARVVIGDIDESGGKATVGMIGDCAVFERLDVTSERDWQSVITATIERFGGVDVLANIAGIGISGDFEDTRLDDWNRVVAVNMTGPFLGAKHGVRAISRHGRGGAIVTVASIAAQLGASDLAAYSASKGGVVMLMKCVALHCAERRYNIRVNVVNPTFVDTEMLDHAADLRGGREALISDLVRLIPAGRLARPEDVARAVLFLASDEATLVTGTVLNVDGGQTAGFPAKHSKAQ